MPKKPTERHEEIAQLANEIRAQQLKAAGHDLYSVVPYTATDIQIMFRAWQRVYQNRKATGRLQRTGSRWSVRNR